MPYAQIRISRLRKMAENWSSQINSARDSTMHRAFSTIDRDEDGAISFRKVKIVLKALGLRAHDHDIKTSIQRIGTPGTGIIKVEEFISALAPITSREASDREISHLFMAFDRDKDGVIGVDDLSFVLGITGRTHSIEELNAMMRELDVDSDGVVTYGDFYTYMKRIY